MKNPNFRYCFDENSCEGSLLNVMLVCPCANPVMMMCAFVLFTVPTLVDLLKDIDSPQEVSILCSEMTTGSYFRSYG